MRSVALVVLCACATAAPGPAPVPIPAPVAKPRALGMNDVSILLPLPGEPSEPVLATITGLVDRAWFDAVVTAHGDLGPKLGDLAAFEAFQVVAVRFDLCDRLTIGACPAGGDGRLRLVLQPCVHAGQHILTQDVAVHAFYPIAADELAGVIDELRALAAIQSAPVDAPLMVSPAVAAGNAAYVARLRTLVLRFARADRLARLTVIGQRHESAAFAWVFRGLDRDEHGGFVPMVIPAIEATQQATLLAGGDTVFDAAPIADAPAGFALATNGARFAAASEADRRGALAALTELQDPTRHDTIDTQCLACHVATYLTARRAKSLGVDPTTVPGRFAPAYNVSVDSVASRDPRVVRAFGWAGDAPAISQRVANDTAEVLAEIAIRYRP